MRVKNNHEHEIKHQTMFHSRRNITRRRKPCLFTFRSSMSIMLRRESNIRACNEEGINLELGIHDLSHDETRDMQRVEEGDEHVHPV